MKGEEYKWFSDHCVNDRMSLFYQIDEAINLTYLICKKGLYTLHQSEESNDQRLPAVSSSCC